MISKACNLSHMLSFLFKKVYASVLGKIMYNSHMSNKIRKILVTSALPYANGPLHLGHMLEHIQSDIWVKFQRLCGNDCYFVCGVDAHGTPVMLQAERLGITPESLVGQYHKEHLQDLVDFGINYDNFYTTHSSENQELVNHIYFKLQQQGDIITKTIQQAFDPVKNIFLPDRYVKGNCPKCDSYEQYGDSCEACGAHYSPFELNNPISIISGATPIQKVTEHYFFCLEHYSDFLEDWISRNHLQSEISHKLQEWFSDGLRQWDISRDSPYFGFEIPNASGKYFYVWLDAPVGYIASFKNLCHKQPNISFLEYWRKDSTTELYHFVGKDIIYFHALFWPAMLHASNFRTPTQIYVHGFLTINGEKMSKSRGTFITVRNYLAHLNPEYLRYYFAAKLTNGIDDIDFTFEDFISRINSDLIGKFVNIASRCGVFIQKKFDKQLSPICLNEALYDHFVDTGDTIAKLYETRQYASATRVIMKLADEANRFIDGQKPWVLFKDPEKYMLTHQVCSLGINLFRLIATYLKPILPNTIKEVESFLNIPELNWKTRYKPLLRHTIKPFKPLMQRIDPFNVEKVCRHTNSISR